MSLRPTTHRIPVLRALNLVSAALLILAAIWFLMGSVQSRQSLPSSDLSVETLLGQESLPVWNLLVARLEQVRREAKATAELTTHIFTNPESYRLAASPGEYSYDETTGVYGSVRNDGLSVVLLSAASALNPDILREIRLSEYLNPIFKSSASLNPLYRQISLVTTDSLVRAYPWFDFRSRVASGALKRNFLAGEFSFFGRITPLRNPGRGVVCETADGDLSGDGGRIVCSAAFFSGEQFRGAVAISVDGNALASQAFDQAGVQDKLLLFLGEGNLVLGTTQAFDRFLPRSPRLNGTRSLTEMRAQSSSGFEAVIRELSGSTRSGQKAGLCWLVSSAAALPVKLLMIAPEEEVRALGKAVSGRSSQILPLALALLGGLLLAANAWWMSGIERNLRESSRTLSESFTALSDLNLNSALIQASPGLFSDLYPKFNAGLESIQKALDASRESRPPETLSPFSAEELRRDLQTLSRQVDIFSSLRAGDSLEANFSKLAAVLMDTFSAQSVVFFSYSAVDDTLRPSYVGTRGFQGKELASVPELKEGTLFEALIRSQRPFCDNVSALSEEEQQYLGGLVGEDCLAVPLLEGERAVGAVLLSGKASRISPGDQQLLEALQSALSATLKNLFQCEGLAKLDLLRREYCLELSKAVEAPLDRIRAEVQSIYSRLGKLTPYYKQHCETILFEVGKLYEVVREAREAAPANEKKPEEAGVS